MVMLNKQDTRVDYCHYSDEQKTSNVFSNVIDYSEIYVLLEKPHLTLPKLVGAC